MIEDRSHLYFWLGRKAEVVKIKPEFRLYAIDPEIWRAEVLRAVTSRIGISQ